MAKKKLSDDKDSLVTIKSSFISQEAVRKFMQQTKGTVTDLADLVRPETPAEKIEAEKINKLKTLVSEIFKICGYDEMVLQTNDTNDLLALAVAALSEVVISIKEKVDFLGERISNSSDSTDEDS